MKTCNDCKEEKPFDHFYRVGEGGKYYSSYCKPCHLARNRAHEKGYRKTSKVYWNRYRRDHLAKYGLTPDDYERMFEEQDGGCKICGHKPTGEKRDRYLAVDHCHDTGAVRGLLCSACNSGLGHFKDDPLLLEKAIRYLIP